MTLTQLACGGDLRRQAGPDPRLLSDVLFWVEWKTGSWILSFHNKVLFYRRTHLSLCLCEWSESCKSVHEPYFTTPGKVREIDILLCAEWPLQQHWCLCTAHDLRPGMDGRFAAWAFDFLSCPPHADMPQASETGKNMQWYCTRTLAPMHRWLFPLTNKNVHLNCVKTDKYCQSNCIAVKLRKPN